MNATGLAFPHYAAVLLAAGASTRMGRPKMLLPWGETTVIGSLLSQWSRIGVGHLAVVIRSGDEPLHAEIHRFSQAQGPDYCQVHVLENANPRAEMWSSIQCAAHSTVWPAHIVGVVIALGDQPHLSDALLSALLRAHAVSSESSRILRPRFGERTGHPVVMPMTCFKSLSDERAEHLKSALESRRASWSFLDWEESALFEDLDTPEDYERISARSMRFESRG